MRAIAAEYYRASFGVPLRFFIVAAVCAAAFSLTGSYSRENARVLAFSASAVMAALALWKLAEMLTAPLRFGKRLAALPENASAAITADFAAVPTLGRRWFYEEYLLYFDRRGIRLIRYDEMRSADLKGNRLYLALEGGSVVPLPFTASENPAMIVAVLRSRNGGLCATIDGRSIDFDKKKRNNGKEDA